MRRTLGVDVEGFQRRPAGMYLHHYCTTNYGGACIRLPLQDKFPKPKSSLDLSKEPLSGGESGIRTHDETAFNEGLNFLAG
jgi:hypothetical protein